ncbi:hypothetical protein [Roseibium sp.]|uniref:hypothetical protein n=1 Tax=Roseibium sp. TaxID=1936156 RepID=UPI003B52811E
MVTAVDDVFAEEVALKFLADGKADPERENISIVAPLRTDPVRTGGFGREQSENWSSQINGQGGMLKVDRATYPDLDIREGDKVRAIERTGQPWFVVKSVDSRHHVRLIVHLGAA